MDLFNLLGRGSVNKRKQQQLTWEEIQKKDKDKCMITHSNLNKSSIINYTTTFKSTKRKLQFKFNVVHPKYLFGKQLHKHCITWV